MNIYVFFGGVHTILTFVMLYVVYTNATTIAAWSALERQTGRNYGDQKRYCWNLLGMGVILTIFNVFMAIMGFIKSAVL